MNIATAEKTLLAAIERLEGVAARARRRLDAQRDAGGHEPELEASLDRLDELIVRLQAVVEIKED